MTAAIDAGWGGTGWGTGPWGSGAPDLELLSALAVRENVVRVFFSVAPKFADDAGATDAANPRRFSVAAVSGVGIDGNPVRPVRPILVTVAPVPGAAGAALDVTVDRPFSAWPTVYLVAANNLVSKEGAFLLAGASSLFDGVLAAQPPPTAQSTIAAVDILTAESARDLAGIVPANIASSMLGKFVADASGDYASASPLAAYRTRVMRRLISIVGSFAHLTGYGTGLPSSVKKPARAGTADRLAALAEEQIRLEPETVSISVTVEDFGDIIRFHVHAITKFGADQFSVPVRR